MHQNGRPLQDIKVLVTRPKQRASGLCQQIERAGGIPLHFAAIEIAEPANKKTRDYIHDHLAEFSVAIFISPTAVEETLNFIPALPDGLSIAAIGSKTARSLEARGIGIDITSGGHDSESLLKHPELQSGQVSGRQVVIFRGEGGRELLGDTLHSRGAGVYYADMYRRVPPDDSSRLAEYLAKAEIITVSSNEGLQNLYDLAPDKNDLTGHMLIVPGQRGLSLAQTLGFKHIIMAQNATDEACMNALKYATTKMSRKV